MRWFGLLLLLALAACDEPRSAAYSPERGNNFKPVAVELQSAQLAQKIDGIATLVSPDSLTLLNAEIRAAEIASGFSQRSLDRYKGIRTLGEQRVDNAERQASTDATQVALLKLRLRNAWGDTAPFLAAANRDQLVDELASGKTTIVRLDFPRSVDRDLRNVRITPLGGGEEIIRHHNLAGAVRQPRHAGDLVLRTDAGRARACVRATAPRSRPNAARRSRRRHRAGLGRRRVRRQVLVLRREAARSIRAQASVAVDAGRWRISHQRFRCGHQSGGARRVGAPVARGRARRLR